MDGTATDGQLAWAVPDADTRHLDTTYRQTEALARFAHELLAHEDDIEERTRPRMPKGFDDAGLPPSLGLSLQGSGLARWLWDRIEEVIRHHGKLPSIAVVVEREDRVAAIFEAMTGEGDARGSGVRVQAFTNGADIGDDQCVRVFSIEHVKGLEFEAVFFVNVDKLAASHPTLVRRFLYVGASRAAGMLGLTCEGGSLPTILEPVADMFAPRMGQS